MPRKEPNFVERIETAANAKKAQLEKMRATAPAGDAKSAEPDAARMKAAAARKLRTAERKSAERAAAHQRQALRDADKARQAGAVIEENLRKHAERVARAEAEAALQRDQKAARDSKYAARKARQK